MAKKLVVLCDGTWCGPETDTESNIYRLAWMMGINPTGPAPTFSCDCIQARYFKGVGLGGSFMSYLWDGAFASDREKECSEVYEFIVQNFTPDHEIWMFGLSRGAYTVRSVAGMINNCGIVQDMGNRELIKQIYKLYRSPYSINEPWSQEMQQFRWQVSHHVQTPIKFMGLFDTVGSLGIPRLNYDTGVGFEWPEFHDNEVSSVVEKVYHAMSIHDRLWAFQPCLASRNVKHVGRSDLRIYQKWFPGAHYDLGRQQFRFLRQGNNIAERLVFTAVNYLSRTVYPNEQLSDLVLLWMLKAIRAEGGSQLIRRDEEDQARGISTIITHIQTNITRLGTGSGDIYANILSYLPFGKLEFIAGTFVWSVDKLWPVSSELQSWHKIFFGTRDRMIPDPGNPNNPLRVLVRNQVYNYTIGDPDLNGRILGDSARVITPQTQRERYPSRTFEDYANYMVATGRNI
ncbi:hypothetical protein LTR50_003340 [Elasticomyces elasticus]|nr:hypothetical protein LTR50_003340 [Elasticomyces elasticus]